MEKLNMESKDILSENIEKVAKLFPNVLVESEDGKKIDFDILRQELTGDIVDGPRERYHLDFPGKREAIIEANRKTTKTLRPMKDKSVNFDTTKNIYIEGDNLEALKILQESYLGKIKCIYIDPPYNTGNDFVYNDDFSHSEKEELEKTGRIDENGNVITSKDINNESKGRYHSDWLKMMYPRLKLARNLLSEDGVIFISIDEKELDNLREILNEIFGENNFIGLFVVENNPKGRKNGKFISVTNEFCIVCAKNYEKAEFKKTIPKHANDMEKDKTGNYVRKSGKRVLMGENFLNKKVTNFSSDKHYTAYIKNKDIIFKQEKNIDEIDKELIAKGYIRYITFKNNEFVENTYTKNKFKELFENEALDIRDNKIYEKHFSDMMQIKSVLVNDEYDAILNNKLIHFQFDCKTTSAKQDLNMLMEGDYFSFPKNINFIENLIMLNYITNDAIILDFFSGSATTAHAVMKLNAEDGGNRQFIMVQLPEATDEGSEAYKSGFKNICDIGEERIRRAGKKILEEMNVGVDIIRPKSLDIGFRVYKIDDSNMKDIYYKPSELSQENVLDLISNVKEDRTALDLLTQVMLNLGLTLDLKIEEKIIGDNLYYFVEDNALVACFDNKINLDTLKDALIDKPLKIVCRENCFEKDQDKINFNERIKKYSPETEKYII